MSARTLRTTSEHHLGQEPDVPQGTVKMFDPETRTGSVLTDTQEEVLIDAEAFAASGLMELRLGQRVRFEVDDAGGTRIARGLNLVSL